VWQGYISNVRQVWGRGWGHNLRGIETEINNSKVLLECLKMGVQITFELHHQ